MAKLKLTTQALKQEQEALRRYERFLPTLQLKKLQLQMEYNQSRDRLAFRLEAERKLLAGMEDWLAVLGEEVGLERLLRIASVSSEAVNVAGVEVRRFKSVAFEEAGYSLYDTPPWLDTALREIRRLLELRIDRSMLERETETLGKALLVTIQRVNLFEKVKIPETKDNIRRIRIFLADQQTAAVVRGKIAKAKLAAAAEKGRSTGVPA